MKHTLDIFDQHVISCAYQAVENVTGMSREQITHKLRVAKFVRARRIVMKLIRTHSNLSLEIIGQETGGKDHATILHNCKVHEDHYQTDREYRELFQRCRSEFIYLLGTDKAKNMLEAVEFKIRDLLKERRKLKQAIL